MTKRPPRVDATRIGSKKIAFQLELKNGFETLQELDDIDAMSEAITDMIQQSVSRVVKTQATAIEHIITNTCPDDETTRNCGKQRQ